MERQLREDRPAAAAGTRRGALETFPGDVFANDREGNVPSEVSASALTLGLPRGGGMSGLR